ncbi:gamma-type small acid-soluble spore protein [Bacillus sp. mrc49]|uniref:gamma-type small acid-soluble spore protein n=1 Tax=Bacillus sp. mrc49 TaxID=2054913 RepID=UPI000C27BFB0|nr:gamma-type small acid-soluble spore protein [Bacillus sp. mrc49]PJN89152.1 gamma-type small acid-soluble spore protein [Bacillus sp. mrc49]
MEKKNQAGNFRQHATQSETEFASETNALEVIRENQQSTKGKFEFASETNIQEVKKQNQQSEGR